jgi:hypothetical protein
MTVDPTTDAARALKTWWDALPTSERTGLPSVGDGSASGSGGSGREARELSYLSAVDKAAKVRRHQGCTMRHTTGTVWRMTYGSYGAHAVGKSP